MLVDKIIHHLRTVRSASECELVNALYNNCMNKSNSSNGARVSSIVKACNKSELIGCFHSANGSRNYFVKTKVTLK